MSNSLPRQESLHATNGRFFTDILFLYCLEPPGKFDSPPHHLSPLPGPQSLRVTISSDHRLFARCQPPYTPWMIQRMQPQSLANIQVWTQASTFTTTRRSAPRRLKAFTSPWPRCWPKFAQARSVTVPDHVQTFVWHASNVRVRELVQLALQGMDADVWGKAGFRSFGDVSIEKRSQCPSLDSVGEAFARRRACSQ